jgi:hypothetical protein
LSILTEPHAELITTIAQFGGYVSTEMLAVHNPSLHYQTHHKRLKKLRETGYLVARPNFRQSNGAEIFQVTMRACSLVGRPDAHMRRLHQKDFVQRSLMRAWYLNSLVAQGYDKDKILGYSDERVQYFRGLQVPYSMLPAKFNHGDRIAQVEEFLFLFSVIENCPGITVLHTRKPGTSIHKTFARSVSNYVQIARLPQVPAMTIVCLVDCEEDEILYNRHIEQWTFGPKMRIEVVRIDKRFSDIAG